MRSEPSKRPPPQNVELARKLKKGLLPKIPKGNDTKNIGLEKTEKKKPKNKKLLRKKFQTAGKKAFPDGKLKTVIPPQNRC